MSRLNSIIIFCGVEDGNVRNANDNIPGAVDIFNGDQHHLYWGNMGGT